MRASSSLATPRVHVPASLLAVALAACAPHAAPTHPASATSAGPVPIAQQAPAPLPVAGPRCPASGAEEGTDILGARQRARQRSPRSLAGRSSSGQLLPLSVLFDFGEVPSARGPSLSAKLLASDWDDLANWMLRAVTPGGAPGARHDPLGSREGEAAASTSVAYLPFFLPTSPLRNATSRVVLIKVLGPAVRAIAASSWFARSYARDRSVELGMNVPPMPARRSISSVRAGSLETQCAYLASLQHALTSPGLSPVEADDLRVGIKLAEEQIDRWKSDPKQAEEWAAAEHATAVAAIAEERRRSAERAERVGKIFPEDPRQALLLRLDTLMAETADVDFSARTIGRNGHQVFVDPTLEAKPAIWKGAYRLGKPTMEALRAFATEWRKELAQGAPVTSKP